MEMTSWYGQVISKPVGPYQGVFSNEYMEMTHCCNHTHTQSLSVPRTLSSLVTVIHTWISVGTTATQQIPGVSDNWVLRAPPTSLFNISSQLSRSRFPWGP